MINTLFKKILRILSKIAIVIFKLCACLIILGFLLLIECDRKMKSSYKDLGSGFTYYGWECMILGKGNTLYVESDVISYNFDSLFIIAKQIPINDKKRTDYWIIDKSQRTKVGPLNYLQFIEECRSRDIKLRLED